MDRARTDRVENVVNVGVEVLVYSYLPTRVVVRVWNKMDIDLPLFKTRDCDYASGRFVAVFAFKKYVHCTT